MSSSQAMRPHGFTGKATFASGEVKPFLEDPEPKAATNPTLPTKRLLQPPTKHTRWWKLEILWAAITVVSLIALIVFLRMLDGQQARTWGFITPNTVVAILTTLLSSSMTAIISASISQGLWNWFTESPTGYRTYRPRTLKDLELFDAASRGPAGGLRLLWRLRGSHLATIGCLLVILNLGLGAFTQQLVAIEIHNVLIGVAPGLPRSERFTAATFGDLPRLPTSGAPDIPTKAAIYNAAIGGNITDLTPTCLSGNCTYPLTPTLAMCGECTDVSSALNYTGSCNLNDTWVCSSQLPNHASLTFDSIHAHVNSWAIFNITPIDLTGPDVPSPNPKPLVYNDTDKLYTLVFDAIGLPPKLAFQWFTPAVSDMDTAPMPPMQAHECALWWCLQSYDLSVTDGVAHKTLVQTWSEVQNKSNFTNNNFANINFTNIPSSMNTDPEASYGIDSLNDQKGVQTALSTISLDPGQAIVQYLDDDQLVAFGSEALRQASGISDISLDIIEGAWQGSDNFHDANGTGWIDVLARSLSNNIATTNFTYNSTAYQGTSWAPASFVVVQWYYIAFPAALTALSLLFFVLTTVETRRKAIYPWRVGLLTLLLMRVDGDLQNEAVRERALDRPHGLDTIRREELRLRRGDDGGWAFERRPKVTQLEGEALDAEVRDKE